MNYRKVITGGLVAGVIMIIFNIVTQLVLGDHVQHEMNAWIPGAQIE